MRSDRRQEFEQVAMAHTESLLRVARRVTGSPHSAEDAVQDTFLAAWRSFHQFEKDTNVRAWLFKIMFNTLSKKRSRPSLAIIEIAEGELLENIVPIRISYSELACSDVIAAIDRLPEEQRAVILLAAVEGFTCKEIGAMLGLPIGTVMSRLSRGRADVRNTLRPTASRSGNQRILRCAGI